MGPDYLQNILFTLLSWAYYTVNMSWLYGSVFSLSGATGWLPTADVDGVPVGGAECGVCRSCWWMP